MAKNLTDRVKREIVKTQIDFLKTNYPSRLIDYEELQKGLKESLINYFPKEGEMDELNEKVDMDLLESLAGNRRRGIAVRLINCTNAAIEDSESFNIKDKDLMQLYERDKEKKWIRNYGDETRKLLINYLTKKGLIEE